jgi:hypothetical protein
MDINKIFDIFNDGENTLSQSEQIKKEVAPDVLELYKDHPLFWVGMFKKLSSYKEKVIQQGMLSFQRIGPGLDLKEVKEVGEFIFHTTTWKWISKIDPNKTDDQYALLYYNQDISLYYIISPMIKYYEKFEEYEKCNHLKNILDFLQRNQK